MYLEIIHPPEEGFNKADFTGIYYYRDLINWQRFKGMVAESGIDCDILHVFSPVGAGDNALSAFGESIAQQLIHYTEEQLCSIDSEDSIGNVYFRAVHGAREGMASDFPVDEPMIALDKVLDPDAKKILESADRTTIYSYRNPNNPPDAGSSLIWQYGKGLEKLLHQEITSKIGYKLRVAFGGRKPLNYHSRPKDAIFEDIDSFWDLFWDSYNPSAKQISLGQWAQLSGVLKKYPKKSSDDKLLQLLREGSSSRLLEIMQKCDKVAEIRNEAVHPNVIPFEVGMVKRRDIIPIINKIIDLVYPDSS